jgi:hypothetical protein
MRQLQQLWTEEDGVLSFEWTIICAVIVFGIVAGLAAARDVVIDELGDMAEAVISIDQSYTFTGLPQFGIPGSDYDDNPGQLVDCGRQTLNPGQPVLNDGGA